MIPRRDAQSYSILGCAAAIAGLYLFGATRDITATGPAAVTILLLVMPAIGVWRGRGRAAFWYALVSTWIVAHALWLAADATSRPLGIAMLLAAGALFVMACAFARRRGLAAG